MTVGGTKVIEAGPGGRRSFVSVSPDGRYAVIAVTAADASRLYAFDRDSDRAMLLHSGSPDLVYSGDWAEKTGNFAFGYYVPEGKRMGSGDIRLFAAGATEVTRAGCSASRSVASWLPDGNLLIRDSDNLYIVEPSGCGTLRTIDARKMHHLVVSPSGKTMAYIVRELVYNRDTRTYEADSTLYVSETTGGDAVKVLGDKYKPRNFAWSPDGSELAFDAELQDGSGRRAISIFSLNTRQSSYLVPPSPESPSQEKPSWSPAGNHILFRSTGQKGDTNFMYRTSGEPFSRAIPWADKDGIPVYALWVDENMLLVAASDGTSALIEMAQGAEIYRATGLLHALPPR